jgi:hypothetical protein
MHFMFVPHIESALQASHVLSEPTGTSEHSCVERMQALPEQVVSSLHSTQRRAVVSHARVSDK